MPCVWLYYNYFITVNLYTICFHKQMSCIFIVSTGNATLTSFIIKIRITILITKATLQTVTMSIFLITAKGLLRFIKVHIDNIVITMDYSYHYRPHQIKVLLNNVTVVILLILCKYVF